jgi:shikimate kinase
MNLYLIGYRGTGKTTVAAALAEKLGRPWFDADVEIERRAGKSIREVFTIDGEPAFRDWESAVIADLSSQTKIIISVGGGAVIRPQNREVMKASGYVVWLQALPETILERMVADPTTGDRRPNLTTLGGLAEIEALLAERTPLYAQCADITVDTEGKSPEAIAEEIVAVLPPGH